jgi:hypothetical protein
MDLDSRQDDEPDELFDFEMDGEGGSAGTSGPEDGGMGATRMLYQGQAGLLPPRPSGPPTANARYAAHRAHAPAVAYGVSVRDLRRLSCAALTYVT